ncbi:PREDICTED: uncharacterized protein LOC109358024 [Lupinus angustifolius]|uniref:uncharacterized protein LOC109358024 n=1 Tax=Lupinus angustifolius TaxID=3871 RepID=UPI00092FA40B|nr:PREDICTED: uncharacterized protein LOC109358024 [Lupinus angustifolius]
MVVVMLKSYVECGIIEAAGHSGGIWVLTIKGGNFSTTIITTSSQSISLKICCGPSEWICTAVYASPSCRERDLLWDHIMSLRNIVTLPWFLLGDFNEVLLPSETRGGHFNHSRANRFAHVLEVCGLMDIGAVGSRSTWFRREHSGRSISKRLDRGLSNSSWRTAFPEGYVENLTKLHSDHSPLLVRCGGKPEYTCNRPFRFQVVWTTHLDFDNVVQVAWQHGARGVVEGLDRIRQDSIAFNKSVFGNIFRRKRRVEARIQGIQRKLEVIEAHDLARLEVQLRREYNNILHQEECLWKRNKIHGLFLDDGSWCTNTDLMRDEAHKYFHALFCETTQVLLDQCPTVTPVLSNIGVTALTTPVTKKEMTLAIMSLQSFKAPDAFKNGFPDARIVEILIVLIPKVTTPTTLKDFRPISLCNVVYKIITKVLVKRLRPFLDELVGPLQSSFIPGRGTSDNIVLAQEVMHHLHKSKAKKGVMAFKVDLEKAYDRVNWDFLEHTLLQFGFPTIMVNLIMWCIRPGRVSLLWNGSRLDGFHPKRGLRQGDHMSPYLFVRCMEKLALSIHHKVENGMWLPIQLSRGGPSISHLLFADDILFFCKATNSQVRMVSETLKDFCKASGLKVNEAKSKFMCSNTVTSTRKNNFMNICSMRVVSNLGNYLGIPLVQGKVGRAVFNPIMEKIQRRMSTWKAHLLNKTGRLCLAKSVISSISSYSMQVMWLPQSVCSDINKMTRNFMWGGDANKRSLNLVSWDVLTKHKRDGGLGLRDARSTNISLLAGTSYTWRSIMKATHILKDGFNLQLGEGNKSLWYDNCIRFGTLCNFVPFVNISDTQLQVKDIWTEGTWDFSALYTMVPSEVKELISNHFTPGLPTEEEGWIWEGHVTGNYSANSGYWWINKPEEDVEHLSSDWKLVWRLKVPEKIKMLCWLGFHEALPSNDLRFRRNLTANPMCMRCNGGVEDLMHVFRDCPASSNLWKRIGWDNSLFWVTRPFRSWVLKNCKQRNGLLFLAGMWWNFWDWNQTVHAICERDICWQRPDIGTIKINVDGSCIRSSLIMGGGGVIRDHAGQWLSGFSANFGVGSAILAELLAMDHGLKLAWELGFKKVHLESDCLEAVHLLSSGIHIRHQKILKVVSVVRSWLSRDWIVEVDFVVREANQVADFMARIGSHSSDKLRIWSTVPIDCQMYMVQDQHPLS